MKLKKRHYDWRFLTSFKVENEMINELPLFISLLTRILPPCAGTLKLGKYLMANHQWGRTSH